MFPTLMNFVDISLGVPNIVHKNVKFYVSKFTSYDGDIVSDLDVAMVTHVIAIDRQFAVVSYCIIN